MKLSSILEIHQKNFLQSLKDFFIKIKPENSGENELLEAMKYSCISEKAKYIRSFIVFETFKMLSEKSNLPDDVIKLGIAVELVHAYSLIHDDLPSMDDSNERRGSPSLHIKFKESTALLAGNSLLTLAFELIASLKNPVISVKIIMLLAQKAGIGGIMSGQVMDLNPDFKRKEFEQMNYFKTGKLFEFCLLAPAFLLEITEISNLITYAQNLGSSYQMVDDLLDAGEESFGYLSLYSRKELESKLEEGIIKCKVSLAKFKLNASLLELPELLIKRTF